LKQINNGRPFVFWDNMVSILILFFFLSSIINLFFFSIWSFDVLFIGIWGWYFFNLFLCGNIGLEKTSRYQFGAWFHEKDMILCLRKNKSERTKIKLKKWRPFGFFFFKKICNTFLPILPLGNYQKSFLVPLVFKCNDFFQ